MTVPELAAFLKGFKAFNCPDKADEAPTDEEYLAVLAEEQAAGRA